MKISEIVKDGTVIFSGEYNSNNFPRFPDKNNWSLYRYAKLNSRNFVPFFFIETMELTWSFNIRNKVKKFEIYQENEFPVIPQQHKITGFERIKNFYDKLDLKIEPKEKLIRKKGQGSLRNFDILFRNKYEYKYLRDIYRVTFYD